MQFENTFDVPAPIDEVFAALLDVERVAPCVPGAEVLEQTSEDAYKISIKVKVGPMSMTYKGDVEIVSQDPAAHRAVMRAKAREARGQGTANADVVMTLTGDGGSTRGTIETDVQLSGRVASMGRGIIQDVSAKIIDQFSENLAAMLSGPGAASTTEAAPAAEPTAPVGEDGATTTTPPRPKEPAAAEAELSAASLAGAVISGRLQDPKVAAGALAGAFVLGWLIGRR